MARRIANRAGHSEPVSMIVYSNPKLGIERLVAAVTGTGLPGLGGTREKRWASDADIVEDVLLLSKGMLYKARFHQLPYVGGKVGVQLTEDADLDVAYTEVARLVSEFEGRLITTEDMGTDPARMSIMYKAAPSYILGRPIIEGGSGDPSPYTAAGVVSSIEATAAFALNRPLKGLDVYVKGVGHVGGEIVRRLLATDARVVLSDVDSARLARFRRERKVTVVDPDAVVTASVFCPCAGGGDVSENFAHDVMAIVGAANNQLTDDSVAAHLADRVVYVPDWVANGGGLISVAAEHMGRSQAWAITRAEAIGSRVDEMLRIAAATGATPLEVAYSMCKDSSEPPDQQARFVGARV